MIFHVLKIIYFNVINIIIENYDFQNHRFIIVVIKFFFEKKDYEFCFNIEYIINFINRIFF